MSFTLQKIIWFLAMPPACLIVFMLFGAVVSRNRAGLAKGFSRCPSRYLLSLANAEKGGCPVHFPGRKPEKLYSCLGGVAEPRLVEAAWRIVTGNVGRLFNTVCSGSM